ncbi:MAG: DUF2232 domain-containing protein [Clostridium sp.]|uniref:DUF2232 domain-containing protein n=1 Tax=Clostridium sp. TaxID=1506 RepID=UPI0039EB8124
MHNKKYNTKALVESGIMAAILVVTMLISIYIPLIDTIAYLALPIPIALTYARNGFKYAFASLISGALVGVFIIGPIKAVQLIIISFFVGLTLGYCIIKHKKASKTMIYLSAAFGIVVIINLFLISLFIYKNGVIGFVDNIVNTFNESINITRNMYLGMGVAKDEIERALPSNIMLNRDQIIWILPGMVVIISLVLAFFNYKMAESIFSRLKVQVDKLKGITYFYIPSLIGAFMIVLVCIGLIFKSRNMLIGNYVFYSTYALLSLVLTINGIAAVIYFLRNKLNFSNGFIVITIILLLLAYYSLFMIIGVIELIVDSRKLDPNRIRKIR